MSQLPTIKNQTKPQVATPFVPKVKEVQPSLAVLSIPVLNVVPLGYFSNRVDLTFDSAQKATMQAILLGLQNKFAKLKNGKEVSNSADAIKWMVENVAI